MARPDSVLVASVRTHWIIEPLVVCPLGDGHYETVAGEGRYRRRPPFGLRGAP